MAGDQDDPFLWGTDRLAQEFSSSRLSSTLTPGRKLPDLNNLAARIREQELDGQTLLTYEDELGIAGLWEDLGIKKAPHKLSVNELIRHLKKRSPKYEEWKASLLDGSPKASRSNEEDSDHVLAKVPPPNFASAPNGGISGHSDVSGGTYPAVEVAPVGPGVGGDLPATRPGTSGKHLIDTMRADSPTPNDSPAKKRKIVPTILSSKPPNQFAAPAPTMADTLTAVRIMDAFLTPFSGSHGYLGPTPLDPDSIMQFTIADSLDEVGDEQEFSWVKFKIIPPGRSIQVSKRMNRFLQKGFFAKDSVDAESGTGDPLPFGESDEELEYDSELEVELNEAEEQLKREQLSKSHLTKEKVQEVIDNAIESLRIKWVEKKKPLRDRTAWGIWQKTRREGNRRVKIAREEARVKALDARITDLTKEIMKTGWVNSDGLLDKASLWLDCSVSDQMESQWLIRLLQSPQEPPKPSRLPKLKLKLKNKPVDLGEDEEILTDDEFVIDDDVDGDPMEVDPNHYPDDDIPLADPLDRAASLVSPPDPIDVDPVDVGPVDVDPVDADPIDADPIVADPIDADPRETPDRVVKSENKKPILSTPQKPVASSDVIDIEATPMKKLDQLPDIEDVETIGEIGMAYWTQSKDPERLLVAILFQQAPVWRSDIYKLIRDHDPIEIWDTRIVKEIENYLHSPPVLNAVEFELAKLFNAYHFVTHDRMHLTRFPRVTYYKMKGHKSEFVRFCDLLQSIMPRFILPLTPPTPISPSRVLSPATGVAGQAANVGEGTDDDRSTPNSIPDDAEPTETADASEDIDEDSGSLSESSENMMPSSGKKKQPLRRDKKAEEIRDATLKQKQELEKRAQKLRDRLAQTGSVPSDKTRLIVNETKESDEQALIYINESIGRKIKDHQIEGVRFMWNMLTVNSKVQSGGLLAHAMGLGKTMQVITLLVVIAESARSGDPSVRSQIPEHLRESKTLIICPAGLVENWVDELLSWAPESVLGDIFMVTADIPDNSRSGVIREWASKGGVLVFGITLFTQMVKQKDELAAVLVETPSIVICDEAHGIKNPSSDRSKATKLFKTRCRIALTGSPLTKDVGDYYSMIDWVAPGYLADHAEFRQRFERPIKHGLYKDSDKYAQHKARKQLHVLKALVDPKVHRKDVDVLRHELPKKKEFILSLPLTPMQLRSYQAYVSAVLSSGKAEGMIDNWSFAANMGRLVAHPRIFKIHLERKKKEREALLKEKEARAKAAIQAANTLAPIEDGKSDEIDLDLVLPDHLFSDVLATLTDREIEEHSQSHKMTMLTAILDECKRIGEKVLVFSQSLDTLDYLSNMFNSQKRVWQRLDGSTNIAQRQNAIKKFNSDDSFEVYLISTRAGGVGFNIYGANRVIIFDFKYTPAEEQQAIGRAYRIGQTKPVYVYWLTAGGTFEDAIRNKTVFKTQLASRVVDKKNPLPRSSKLHKFIFPPTIPEKQDLSRAHKMDPVLDSLVRRFGDPNDDDCILRNVTFTETFEEEEVFELTPEDKLEAERDIETERLRITNPDEYKRREQERLAGMRPEPGTVQFGGPQSNSLAIPPHLRTNSNQTTVTPNSAVALEEGGGSSSLSNSAVAGVAGVKSPAVAANQNMVSDTLSNIRPVNVAPPSTALIPDLVRGSALASPDRVFGLRAPPSTQPPTPTGKLEWNAILRPQSRGSSPKRGNPILGVAKKPLEPVLGKHTQYKETPVPLPPRPPSAPVPGLVSPSPSKVGDNELIILLGSLSDRAEQLVKLDHKPFIDPKELVIAISSAMESRKMGGLPRMDKLQTLDKHVLENPRFADALLSGHLKIRTVIDLDRNGLARKSADYSSMSAADFLNAVWRNQGTSQQSQRSQQQAVTTMTAPKSTTPKPIVTKSTAPKPTTPMSTTTTGVRRDADTSNGNLRGSSKTATTTRPVKKELFSRKAETPTGRRPSIRPGDSAESPQVID